MYRSVSASAYIFSGSSELRVHSVFSCLMFTSASESGARSDFRMTESAFFAVRTMTCFATNFAEKRKTRTHRGHLRATSTTVPSGSVCKTGRRDAGMTVANGQVCSCCCCCDADLFDVATAEEEEEDDDANGHDDPEDEATAPENGHADGLGCEGSGEGALGATETERDEGVWNSIVDVETVDDVEIIQIEAVGGGRRRRRPRDGVVVLVDK